MASDVRCCEPKFYLYVLIIIGLVCFAGLMAGLTLGLMSLGLVDLEVLIKSGRPQDRIHAGTSSVIPLAAPLISIFFLMILLRALSFMLKKNGTQMEMKPKSISISGNLSCEFSDPVDSELSYSLTYCLCPRPSSEWHTQY